MIKKATGKNKNLKIRQNAIFPAVDISVNDSYNECSFKNYIVCFLKLY
jgi:hypothetical protein